jgi:hypothetical protein
MLIIDSLDYLGLGIRIADSRWLFMLSEGNVDGFKIPDEEIGRLNADIKAMHTFCTNLSLLTSAEVLAERLDDPPRTQREFETLVDMVRAELRGKLFLFVPPHLAKYYDLILPTILTNPFPLASKEIVAAGNCAAAGVYTASVFHSMRAAEIGVRALGNALGVTFPDKPIELAEWQTILEQCQSKIAEMKRLPRGTHKDEELRFYSEAAVQLWYFKDAWRVRVAHARATYEEANALKIFDHTLSFFQTLATRLKE